MNGLQVDSLYYVNLILVAFVDSAVSSIVRNPMLDVQTRQILMQHNFYRQIHDSTPLTLDIKLCEEALALAEDMAKGDQLSIVPGTNVFTAKLDSSSEPQYPNPADIWYQEVLSYSKEGANELTRNFTQMMWNSSERLGVGVARSESNTLYVVCKYDPPGNKDEAYEHNVFKRRNDDYGSYDESGQHKDLGLWNPYFDLHEDQATADELAQDIDVVDEIQFLNVSNSVRSDIRERSDARITWWLVFDDAARTVAEEVQHFLWPESEEHSIEKRDIYTPVFENVEETLRNDLNSLLQAGIADSSSDTLLPNPDDSVDPLAARVHGGQCCEEEKDPCADEDQQKKCGCHQIGQLEIVSRKLDMVLVFVVFNNIFMIIFGVAVTLGVVVQWCSGAGVNKRRR